MVVGFLPGGLMGVLPVACSRARDVRVVARGKATALEPLPAAAGVGVDASVAVAVIGSLLVVALPAVSECRGDVVLLSVMSVTSSSGANTSNEGSLSPLR